MNRLVVVEFQYQQGGHRSRANVTAPREQLLELGDARFGALASLDIRQHELATLANVTRRVAQMEMPPSLAHALVLRLLLRKMERLHGPYVTQ